VSQRSAVAPAWEARVDNPRERATGISSYPPTSGADQMRQHRPAEENWLKSIFKSW